LAKTRFQQELVRIKQIREQQRLEFLDCKAKMDNKADYQQAMTRTNHEYNSVYLLAQKEEIEERKREFILREKGFYKPHFGPEETDKHI